MIQSKSLGSTKLLYRKNDIVSLDLVSSSLIGQSPQ